jgi:hypothetical protein
LVGSGCFYTETINERPTPGIRVVGNAGPYFVGDVVTFDATKSIDDAPNELQTTWQAYGCVDDRVPRCIALGSELQGKLTTPFQVTLESHDSVEVQLRVTDAHGASRLQPDLFSIVVGNLPPSFGVQSTGHHDGGPGGPFVLSRAINLLASPSLESGAFDPDGDEVTLDWQLLPPPGSQSAERIFEPEGTDGYRLVPDVDGQWEVVVTAADGYGGVVEETETFFVGADGPPCLQGTDPFAVDDAYYLVDSADGARRFSVLSVSDALDPFPASLDEDPVLGEASFRWFLKSPGDADFVELSGFLEADYLVNPDAYNPGETLELRVEVSDRVEGAARDLVCGPEVWTCALETGSGCNQRITWGVDIR